MSDPPSHGDPSEASERLGGLPIAAGDVLLKKYRIERLIGEGGTGIVLSATHVQLEQKVAIKFLRRALASDEIRTRFEREARAMGKIESNHVVLVLDAGTLDDGWPYMVMEHLEGRDLARVLKEDGPLTVEDAVDCMLQVCEALEHAHAHGIVHRDLKPANLFLTASEDDHVHVKVVDFGISKILVRNVIAPFEPSQDVTTGFTVMGSPRYMAPEQVRSAKDVDERADLWSVGAVLFKLITGEHAFDAPGNLQASIAVLNDEPRPLRSVAPHAPAGLEEIVTRCLEKDVANRFQSAKDLRRALRAFGSERETAEEDDAEQNAVSVPISVRSLPPSRPVDDETPPESVRFGKRDTPTEPSIRLLPKTDPPSRRDPPPSSAAPASVPIPRPSSPSRVWPIAMAALCLGGLSAWRFLTPATAGLPPTMSIGVPTTAAPEPAPPSDASSAARD